MEKYIDIHGKKVYLVIDDQIEFEVRKLEAGKKTLITLIIDNEDNNK
jgi:hypothetical protein